MIEDRQNMTTEELVDILAQKTQRFTQLLVYKDFGNEYKECKETIRLILAEIEIRKKKHPFSKIKRHRPDLLSYPEFVFPFRIALQFIWQLFVNFIQLFRSKCLFCIRKQLSFFKANMIIDKLCKQLQ